MRRPSLAGETRWRPSSGSAPEREARRERVEAQLRQEKAALHEREMADHELIENFEAGRRAELDSRR